MVIRHNTHRVPDELALLQDLAETGGAASLKALIGPEQNDTPAFAAAVGQDASRRKVSAARTGAADRPR